MYTYFETPASSELFWPYWLLSLRCNKKLGESNTACLTELIQARVTWPYHRFNGLIQWMLGRKKKTYTSAQWRLFSYITSISPSSCPCCEKSIKALLTECCQWTGLWRRETVHHQRGEGEKGGVRVMGQRGGVKKHTHLYFIVLQSSCLFAACSMQCHL